MLKNKKQTEKDLMMRQLITTAVQSKMKELKTEDIIDLIYATDSPMRAASVLLHSTMGHPNADPRPKANTDGGKLNMRLVSFCRIADEVRYVYDVKTYDVNTKEHGIKVRHGHCTIGEWNDLPITIEYHDENSIC